MAGAVWRSPSKGQQKGRAERAPESARLTEAAGRGEMEDGARCSLGTELSLRIQHTGHTGTGGFTAVGCAGGRERFAPRTTAT